MSDGRLARMKSGYRKFAVIVSLLLGTIGGLGIALLVNEPDTLNSILAGVGAGVVLFLGTFLLLLGVLATMEGRATMSGRGSEARKDPDGRAS